MVGKITNFLHSVGDLGQSSLDNDMEQATILAQQLWPATTDILPPLSQLNRILEHVLRNSVTMIQNLPQRGSSSEQNNTNEQYFTADHPEILAMV